MRVEIEKKLNITALDIYGLTEIIGPGVSSECEEKEGLHINEDLFYPEIIDPVSGEVLADGEKGELVLTTLTKEGTPIIRFRTRDITYLMREKCSEEARGTFMRAAYVCLWSLSGPGLFPPEVFAMRL